MSYFKKCAKKKNKIKITNIFLFIIIGFFVFQKVKILELRIA